MNELQFLGVRGSLPCPGGRHRRYGGNTACVSVKAAGRSIIFDAGTGLRDFVTNQGYANGLDMDLFLSHGHIDHILGLPAFRPLYEPGNRVRIHGPGDPKALIAALMGPPLYPVGTEWFRSAVSFQGLEPGQDLMLGHDIQITTLALDHPGGALGYRLDTPNGRLVYASDLEHGDRDFESRLFDFVSGVDVLIYDATYDDRNFDAVRGFGHSTWQQGARIAIEAKVGTFIAFHHDPEHDDERLDAISAELLALMPNGIVAREGLRLNW